VNITVIIPLKSLKQKAGSDIPLKPLIQVDHLTYRHPGTAEAAAPALLDVSLRIEEGEMVALVGANGSGKTTLARHLNALLLPTSGEVRINGMDTRDADSHPQIRANVGMVFQHPEDQIVATIVEEDIAFGPENLCHLPPVIREEVDQALKIVGMSEQRRRQPHLLSAGQMQRVALAGVLAMQPRCIIFDETTAMLDPAGRRDVLNRMADLNRHGNDGHFHHPFHGGSSPGAAGFAVEGRKTCL